MDGADRRPRHRGAGRGLRLRLRRRPDQRHAARRSRRPSPTRSATSSMLSLVVGVVALTGWRPGRTWSLLLAGLAALASPTSPTPCRSTDVGLPGGDWIEPIYLIARRLPRRRGLAAARPATIQRRRALRRLARADGPRRLRGGDDRPLRDAVLQRHQRPLDRALGGDDDRRDRPPGDQRAREQAPAGAGADRPADRARQPRPACRSTWTSAARARPTSEPVDAAALRPQRLQALQRHLRPPGRRRAAEPARRRAAQRRSATTAPPTGSAATSSASCSTCAEDRFERGRRARPPKR